MTDNDLEKKILSALCSDSDLLPDAMAKLKPKHFQDQFCRNVFNLISQMYREGLAIDVLTVADRGASLFLGQGVSWLQAEYILPGTFNYFADKLIRQHRHHKLHELGETILSEVAADIEPDTIAATVEKDLFQVTSEGSVNLIEPRELAEAMLETLAARSERRSNGGISTQFVELNKLLNGGFEPGQLVILAAKTGQGKTAFSLNLLQEIAVRQKIPALYLNTEMSEEQIHIRLMALLGRVSHYKTATGTLDSSERIKIIRCLDEVAASKLYPITEPFLTVDKLASICRRAVAQKGIRIVFVDYIGRLSGTDGRIPEWQQLKNDTKKIKTLAQELKVCMVMLAQMTEGDSLQGSRAMLNEADVFGFLRMMDEKEKNKKPGYNYCLDIQKNRSGPQRAIALVFIGETMTFSA